MSLRPGRGSKQLKVHIAISLLSRVCFQHSVGVRDDRTAFIWRVGCGKLVPRLLNLMLWGSDGQSGGAVGGRHFCGEYLFLRWSAVEGWGTNDDAMKGQSANEPAKAW